MNTDWRVDVFVVINGQAEQSENGDANDWFDRINYDAVLPENAEVAYFDTGMESWSDEDYDYHSFEMKVQYSYKSCTSAEAIRNVLADFQISRFEFKPELSGIEIYIDFVRSWAFYDLNNKLTEDEAPTDQESDDGVFPNFLFSYFDGGYGDEDFESFPANWTLSESGTPQPWVGAE